MNEISLITILFGVIAAVPIAGRWLRVAQREHYIAPWVTRLSWLWLRVRPVNLVIAILVALLGLVALYPDFGGLAASAIVIVGFLPYGLGVRGTSAKLAWTDRLKRLLVLWIVLVAVIGTGLTLLLGGAGIVFTLLFAAPITDPPSSSSSRSRSACRASGC